MPMPDDATEQAAVDRVYEAMVDRAHAVGGTCTGEHGIGIGKQRWLVEELGDGAVEVMRMIKRAMDPLDLFNPGKIFAL
jgi:D-lactate dehydrogenase (cytochrome)